jgi:hypothetical protein
MLAEGASRGAASLVAQPFGVILTERGNFSRSGFMIAPAAEAETV